MSSAPKLRTRIATALTVFSLAFVGLSLGDATAASATTKPMSIAIGQELVVGAIDALRSNQVPSAPSVQNNGFVNEYARAYVTAYAACNGCANPTVAEPADIITLPAWADLHPVLTRITGTVASTLDRFQRALTAIPGSDGTHGSFNDKYASVAMVSKGGRIYEAVLFVQADTIPGRISAPTPTITGTSAVGRTLTAHAGAVSPSDAAIGFTWERGDGTILVRNSNTYVPTADDLGQKVFVFDVITKDGYKAVSFASKSAAKVAIGTIVPGKVSVLGHANLSYPGEMPEQLTANIGIWTPLSPNFTYRWYANGQAIAGATAQTYNLPTGGSIKGKRIQVRVSASQAGYKSTTRVSAATAPVGLPRIPVRSAPIISGAATIGSTLTASNSAPWQPGAVHTTWRWVVNGKVVPKATRSTFAVPASAFAKANEQIWVIETGTEHGFAATSVGSGAVFAAPIDFTDNGSLFVAGTTPGHTLRVAVHASTPKATVYHYQWFKDGFPVARATKSSLVTSLENDHTYYVQVIESRAGYFPVTLKSNAVFVTRFNFVLGTANVVPVTPGHTLSATASGFVPSPTVYGYQWFRDGVAVPKATKRTFLSSKGSHSYFVIVRAIRADYNSVATKSNVVRLGPA